MAVLRGDCMPKFYFNLKGNGDLIESDRPIQFPCLATAKADALAIGFAFEICSEAGEVLDIVKFEDAVLLH